MSGARGQHEGGAEQVAACVGGQRVLAHDALHVVHLALEGRAVHRLVLGGAGCRSKKRGGGGVRGREEGGRRRERG